MSQRSTSQGLLRSTGAAAVLQLWRMALVFGTNLVLRRWVDIDSWGLWAWSEALFLVLASVRDFGMSSHVVRLRPPPFRNFLLQQLVWGCALGALIALAAPLLAAVNADPDPRLVPMLRALAVYLFLEGLATVPLVYFESELAIERTVVPEMARSILYAGVAIALAWWGAGVWSFVAAQLIAAAAFAALLWWRAWGRIPLPRLPLRTLDLVRGALPVGGVWLLGLAVMQLDSLVLGWRFSKETVAAYAFAYATAFLPWRILQAPMGRALYPALVAYRDEPAKAAEAYRLATLVLLAIEVPAALFLSFNAELILRLLGGDQWGDAAPFLRLLAFAPIIDPVGRFAGELLIAFHKERLRAVSLVATFTSMFGGALLLIPWLGPMGMAVANFLPFGWLVAAWAVYQVVGRPLWRLVGDATLVYLVPLPLFLAAVWLSGDAPWLRAALCALAGALALLFQWRRLGAGFTTFFRRRPLHPETV
jgi:O-antigen/teichoic acid export membrane protein